MTITSTAYAAASQRCVPSCLLRAPNSLSFHPCVISVRHRGVKSFLPKAMQLLSGKLGVNPNHLILEAHSKQLC